MYARSPFGFWEISWQPKHGCHFSFEYQLILFVVIITCVTSFFQYQIQKPLILDCFFWDLWLAFDFRPLNFDKTCSFVRSVFIIPHLLTVEKIKLRVYFVKNITWDKVFKNGPSKICEDHKMLKQTISLQTF